MQLKNVLASAAIVVAIVVCVLAIHSRRAYTPTNNVVSSEDPPRLATSFMLPFDVPMAFNFDVDVDGDGSLSLSGHVVGGDGHAVNNAEVWIDSVPMRTTRTGPDGTFTFDRLLSRIYRIQSKKLDLVSPHQSVKLSAHTVPVVLQLGRGAGVRVRVITRSGAAIAGAVLEVTGNIVGGVSDADGEVRLGPLATGPVQIDAAKPGYSPQRTVVDVDSDDDETTLAIVLEQGFVVSGRVIDEHGVGVSNSRIFAVRSGWSLQDQTREWATTDPEGYFTIPVVPAGAFWFAAIDDVRSPAATQSLDIDRPHTGLTITVSSGRALIGTVHDAKGGLVPYATISLEVSTVPAGSKSLALARRVTTNVHGGFTIAGLIRGTYQARAESDMGVSALSTLEVGEPLEYNVDFVLEPTDSAIEGFISNTDRIPVTNRPIYAVSVSDGSLAHGSLGLSDASGRFLISGLRPGKYTLWFHDRHGTPIKAALATAGDMNVRLTVPSTGSVRADVILSDAGKLPASFSIRLSGGNGTLLYKTGTRGHFKITDVPPGKYTILLGAPDFADTLIDNVQVHPGKITDLGTIVTQVGRVVRGRVLSSDGRPVSGADVIVAQAPFAERDGNSKEWYGSRASRSDADGAFAISGVPLQSRHFAIGADHPIAGRSEALLIPSGTDAALEFVLVVKACGSISGTLTRGGLPVSHAMVGAGDPELGFSYTGEDGRFVISKVPEGMVDLHISVPSDASHSYAYKVDVTANAMRVFDVELPSGSVTLEVTFSAMGRDWAVAAEVYLFGGKVAFDTRRQLLANVSPRNVPRRRVWSAAEVGAFQFEDLVPGEYSVCVVPLRKALDSEHLSYLEDHGDEIGVHCTPVTVTSAQPHQVLAAQPNGVD
jgi:protocatechuate 3,4-dioxygenase beta subunit